MQQIIKCYCWIILLAVGVESAHGFSLLGPLPPDPGGEVWQVVTIGYDQAYYDPGLPGGLVWLGDIGGPHALGQGYRRNAPILYYSYDQTFAGPYGESFFGVPGQAAVDSAFSIMNSLTNVDQFSHDLTEFPLTAEHYNYTAQSLYLLDLKSVTLHLLVEQMGLADPARYSWTLHDRNPGNSCPVTTIYLVTQRNLDGTATPSLQQLVYTPYVNGTLLSYYISEHCANLPPALGITVPYLTDPEGAQYAPVAANNGESVEEQDTQDEGELQDLLLNNAARVPTIYGLQLGGYYTGLTRDDVAGLRYLYTTNLVDLEPIPATSFLFTVSTNLNVEALFPSSTATNTVGTNGGFYVFDGTYGYGDYGWLVATSLTNSPAVLQALYPGLVIATTTNYFISATNWVYSQYFTNAGIGTTYPPPLTLVTVSNKVLVPLEEYVTTFANVVRHNVSPTTTYKLQTITVSPNTGAPYPASPVTNSSTRTVTVNIPSGDFFVLPQFHGNVCPLDFLNPLTTNVLIYTNLLTGTQTNLVTATNTSVYSSTLIQYNYFTNYTWVVRPVVCAEETGTNAANPFRGIGGVSFVRDDRYDTVSGTYLEPITNHYTMVAYNITNNTYSLQRLVRVVTQPDIVIAAYDGAFGPGDIPFNNTVIRSINYNSSEIVNGERGPGTIDLQSVFTYNQVGPLFENGPFVDGNSFINPNEVNETTQYPLLQWASFDGTTNAPVLYPNTTSLENLENQVVIQLITTPSGPLVGTAGLPYTVQFNAVGGAFSPQFTWTASSDPQEPGSGLPPGLSLSNTGVLSGTPAASGTYDFDLHLTDFIGRTAEWTLSITIN
jgi:hypothetical protein